MSKKDRNTNSNNISPVIVNPLGPHEESQQPEKEKVYAEWAMMRSKVICFSRLRLLSGTSGAPKMLSGGVYRGEGVC